MQSETIKIKMSCYYCQNDFEYEAPTITDKPYLIECDVCHKKLMGVYCQKCGIGGVVVPEASDFAMAAVEDFSKKPSSWRCNNCKKDWPIPSEIYEKSPIVAKSTLRPEILEKIKKKITEKGLVVEKPKAPKLWVFFFVGMASTLIPVIGEIILVVVITWVFLAFLNKKMWLKIGMVLTLGIIAGMVIKTKIAKWSNVVTVPSDELEKRVEEIETGNKTGIGASLTNERLLGLWRQSGTGDRETRGQYGFAENGEFQFNVGSRLCVIAKEGESEGEELAFEGKWEMKGNILELTATSKTILVKGARAIAFKDCGTKEQRVEAVVEKVNLPEVRKIIFDKGECTKPGYYNGCEIATDKGGKYLWEHSYYRTDYFALQTSNPFIFGNYNIELPSGWSWYESDSYVAIVDTSEFCRECPSIYISKTKIEDWPGGGYVTHISELTKLGRGNFATNYLIAWMAYPVEGKEPTEKVKDSDGFPILQWVEGCPREDLCIYFSNDGNWRFDKIKDFINNIVISKN